MKQLIFQCVILTKKKLKKNKNENKYKTKLSQITNYKYVSFKIKSFKKCFLRCVKCQRCEIKLIFKTAKKYFSEILKSQNGFLKNW